MVILYVILCIFAVCQFFSFLGRRNQRRYGITFVAGEIGAGKTTYAAKLARKYMRKGRVVYSNFALDGAYKLCVSDLQDFVAPPNSVLFIDESGIEMNSRQYKSMQQTMINYFKLSRHYQNKIYLFSQTFTDTDKQIRDLSTDVVFLRKLVDGYITFKVRVVGKLGIGQDGQPCMQYRLGRIGSPIFLFLYRHLFDSFECDSSLPFLAELKW